VAVKAPYPGFIEPSLATSIEKVPASNRWIHEIKFDGYRVQIHLRDAAVKLFTRRGNDWTNRFRKIVAEAWHISAGSAIIDGEVVVPSADGTTDFSVLQNELKGRSTKIVMVAFDLLYLNGYDLRKLPLYERKALLNHTAPISPPAPAQRSRCERLSVRNPDEGSLERYARRLIGVPKHDAVVGVDLPDSAMSTLSMPNTEGGPCVCRLTAIVAANLSPS
jgi:ATP-dependent DNA ligase